MKTLKNYIFWAYERGSFHYDVMVTLILVFVFVTPRFIDFKDKPKPTPPPRASEVLVKMSGNNANASRFVYEIRVEDLGEVTTDADVHVALQRVIQRISVDSMLQAYQPVFDAKGKIVAYNATVSR